VVRIPKIPTLNCNRCQHEWYPRMEKLPVRCPECKSPYWNKKRVRVTKNHPDYRKVKAHRRVKKTA
jgi:DNA-directed RNA polymerase subunit RPC12/RpoP